MATTGNPLIAQGYLNRVKASVTVTDNSALNVTASYMGKQQVSIRANGPATDIIQTAAGTVHSQVPYVPVTIMVHCLKTQALAAAWQKQFTTDTSLGEVVVTPDATTFGDFTILNTALVNFQDMPFDGTQAEFVLELTGYWVVNNNMWS